MSCTTGKNRICYAPAHQDLPIGTYFVTENPHHPDLDMRRNHIYEVVEQPAGVRCETCPLGLTCDALGVEVNQFLPLCDRRERMDRKDVIFELVE